MKKLAIFLAGAMLAATMVAFTGCGSSGKGAVSGNYKEPTAEELQTAVENVEWENVLTELKGLNSEANLTVKMTQPNASTDMSLTFSFKETTNGETAAGKGDAKFKLGTKSGAISTSTELTAAIQADADNIYLDTTGLPAQISESGKIKFSISSLLGSITDVPTLPFATATAPAMPDLSEDSFTKLLETCQKANVKIGMDTKKGLKLKISFTEESFWTIVAEDETEEDLAAIKEAATIKKFNIDIYFALNEDGSFNQMSANIDIDASFDASKITEPEEDMLITGISSVKANGYFFVKSYSGNVKITEGIAEDESYIDMSALLGSVGNIGGGMIPMSI